MAKTPPVKPLSKAAVSGRLGFILGFFKLFTFDLAAFFVSKAGNAKGGLFNSKGNSRD